jgi:hypothetical protein
LEQRAEEWESQLRAELKVGRMILRRLIGPLTLFEYRPPEFMKQGELQGLGASRAGVDVRDQPEKMLRGLCVSGEILYRPMTMLSKLTASSISTSGVAQQV